LYGTIPAGGIEAGGEYEDIDDRRKNTEYKVEGGGMVGLREQ